MKATIETQTQVTVRDLARGEIRLGGQWIPWACYSNARVAGLPPVWGHVHLHVGGKWLEAFWPAHEKLNRVLAFAIKAYRSGELFGR